MKTHLRKPAQDHPTNNSGLVADGNFDALLTPSEVAKLLGVDVRTLANWRAMGRGPRFFKPTYKLVYYATAEVFSFMTRIEAQSGREARHLAAVTSRRRVR